MNKDIFRWQEMLERPDAKDYENIMDIISSFKVLVNELPSIVETCNAEIVEADKAFCDLRHYCELSTSLTRSQKTQVCAHIRRYSKRRRAAKDLLRLLTPLWEYTQGNKPFRNAMGTIANKTNNQLQQIKGQRIYTPRVLEELFNDKQRE